MVFLQSLQNFYNPYKTEQSQEIVKKQKALNLSENHKPLKTHIYWFQIDFNRKLPFLLIRTRQLSNAQYPFKKDRMKLICWENQLVSEEEDGVSLQVTANQ